MNPSDRPLIGLTRRACLVWVGSALSACGGGGGAGTGGVAVGGGGGGGGGAGSAGGSIGSGGSGGSGSVVSSAPGTGGTGSPMYAQGSISGFGSVIVSGIKFDDSGALIELDGAIGQSADLRLGMVAAVQGQRSAADASLGTAHAIEVWSIAQGPVERLDTLSADAFKLPGMTIQADANTLLEGISAVSALSSGQTVCVWGLQLDASGAQWKATRVKLLAASANRVASGSITRLDEQTRLNGLLLTGELSEDLQTGAMLRVQGTPGENASLKVSAVKLINAGFETYAGGLLEIEGVVTSEPTTWLQSIQFKVGNITVDASDPLLSQKVSQLAVGQEVEVYGAWSAGTLLASQIVLEATQGKEIEIEARIDQFTSVADFVLRGQRCDATSASFSHGQASELAVGKKIHLKGKIAGDLLQVSQLEFDN